MDSNPIHHPSAAKKMKCFFYGLHSTSDDWPGWVMDSNPIHHPSPAKKNEMLIFGLRSFLMICLADWWTWTSSATPLQPKKWNAQFLITFISDDQPDWSMDSNPIYHPSPANKMKYSFLNYIQLLMISWAGRWTQTPFITPLQPKKWSAHFLIMFNFWWAAGLVNELKPHPPALSSQKNEMLLFGLRSTSDDRLGWSMDSNPILHLSPAKEMKSPFLYYVQLLMIGWAGRWTQTPSTTPLQPKQWNAHLCITFNIWCWPDWSMDLNLIHHSSPAKNMKCSFLGYVHFWWLVRLVDGLKPHPSSLSSQKNEMLIVWLCSTSDDQLGWSMDLNPICHPSPAKKNEMLIFVLHSTSDVGHTGQWTQTPSTTPLQPKKWNASFMDYTQLLMIGRAEWWTQTPSTTPLQPKKWNARFWITFISDDLPGWLMNLNLIWHPSRTKKMKCSIFDYVHLLMISQAGQLTQSPSTSPLQPIKWNTHFSITFNFWWSAGLVNGLEPHPPPLSSQKNEMLNFRLRSTSDDQPGWSMDSNPIHQPSPANKMKYSFLDYVQLLMISWAGRWTQTPFTTPLQPKKLNAHFLIMFNFWWSAGLVNGLNPHPPPLSSQRNEMPIFVLCSTSNDRLGWSMDSNPIHHPSPANKMKCSFS